MSVPEAKLHPQLRRYPLRRLRLPLGREVVSLVVPDAEGWVRQGTWVGAAVRGAEPPYWIRIWPAAVALARLLVRRGSLQGLRVVDLGCGVGVPGATAAWLGANVTFADREADALAFAAWNARHLAPDGRAPEVQSLDWAAGTLAGPFDAMLLADVTYRPLHHRPLLRQIRAALATGGVVVHADPESRESDDFLRQLRAEWRVAEGRHRTSFLGKDVVVRLVVAAADDAALAAWQAPLAPRGARPAEGSP